MTDTSSHSTALDLQAKRLLKLLVSKLDYVIHDNPNTFITYKQVHDELQLPVEGKTLGRSLQHQGLNSLSEWTKNSGVPGITGLIIDKDKLSPGVGYFKLYERDSLDYTWWLAEIKKVKNYDWTPFIADSSLTIDSSAGQKWSYDELHASIVAYLEMQYLDRQHIKFTKKDYYEQLSLNFGRSPKAFEYRMQNISYVLSIMGRDWLAGLIPAKNVGIKTATQIEKIIFEIENKQYSPIVAFELEARKIFREKTVQIPEGNRIPLTTVSSITQFQRDPKVKAWVLKETAGHCECCAQPAPFIDFDGSPFLEVHHIRKLAEGGSDTISNVVAVCPNCHRSLHHGINSKELVKNLYLRIHRLKKE